MRPGIAFKLKQNEPEKRKCVECYNVIPTDWHHLICRPCMEVLSSEALAIATSS